MYDVSGYLEVIMEVIRKHLIEEDPFLFVHQAVVEDASRFMCK